MSKETVQGALAGSLKPLPRRVLEIRQEIAKSSLKKLDAMERCAGPDDRVRGQLAYYGAFRTGRFAGRLIQPQNFPRPSIKGVSDFIRHGLSEGGPDAEWTRMMWGKPLDVIASSLRGCLIPAPGKAFVVYDLSQIEARVVAWLAGQTDVLDVFAKGEDVYVYAAAKIGSPSRQLGKQLTLACGYGMGPSKFQDTAAKAGLALTLEESEGAVKAWRESNSKIVNLWWATDRAVKDLLTRFNQKSGFNRKSGTCTVNDKISVTVTSARNRQPLLTMRLPSGRRLYYRNARLERDEKDRCSIVYDGVDPITKRWGPVRAYGAKIVEHATQSVARDILVEAALRIEETNLGELRAQCP